ncbi:MAG TPA: PfkB family carbohydrate kinase [Pyrinomonadaceae bacterium]|jgi:rfaE bifunctional protein kinase chain/domain|nr:PfkB family carbohydrate kinase [Pyrinomonadaceae bacterium]
MTNEGHPRSREQRGEKRGGKSVGELEERLAALLRTFDERRIVVVGDLLADQFLYGEISRVSREAPVLILRHERTETVPGGAANCALNLASLGAHASLVGVVGADEAGRALLERLRAAGVDCAGVVEIPRARTTTKVRILAGQAHSPRQQVIRVDYEAEPLADPTTHARLAANVRDAAPKADAFIVSDYNYGVAGAEMAAVVRACALERGRPALVDSRFRLTDFRGFTSATPNEDEVEQLAGRRLTNRDVLEESARELRARLDYPALLVTRGSQGMFLLEAGAAPLHIEAVGAHEAVDVTGAGDTVIAAYTLALSSGSSYADAAHLANHAGGLVVMKRGTASVNRDELLASLMQHDERQAGETGKGGKG